MFDYFVGNDKKNVVTKQR